VIYLAQDFLNRYAKKYQRPLPILTANNKSLLKAYHWPGNVRELKNVIERLMIISTGEKLEFDMLELSCQNIESAQLQSDPFSDKPTIDELQRRYIDYILKITNGKLSGPKGAAEILGMKRTTLHTRMKKLGLKK
jgi:DNA-binding NtrC family response regulator